MVSAFGITIGSHGIAEFISLIRVERAEIFPVIGFSLPSFNLSFGIRTGYIFHIMLGIVSGQYFHRSFLVIRKTENKPRHNDRD